MRVGIIDNGRGFDPAQAVSGRGLGQSGPPHRRIGKIELTPDVCGTAFTLLLAIGGHQSADVCADQSEPRDLPAR